VGLKVEPSYTFYRILSIAASAIAISGASYFLGELSTVSRFSTSAKASAAHPIVRNPLHGSITHIISDDK
jgi:hypothetical protein